MADPKEGYNSGVNRNVSGTINDDGNFESGVTDVTNAATKNGGDLTGAADDTATRLTLPTDAISITINVETNDGRFLLGDSSVVALQTSSPAVRSDQTVTWLVGSNTHLSYINETDTEDVAFSWSYA